MRLNTKAIFLSTIWVIFLLALPGCRRIDASKDNNVTYLTFESICDDPSMVREEMTIPPGRYRIENIFVHFSFEFSETGEGWFRSNVSGKHRLIEVAACSDSAGNRYVNFKCEIQPGVFRSMPVREYGATAKHPAAIFLMELNKSTMSSPIESFGPDFSHHESFVVLNLRNSDGKFILDETKDAELDFFKRVRFRKLSYFR